MFVVGASMVAAACLSLAIHCILIFFLTIPPTSDDLLTILFAILFYLGIGLAAAGFVVSVMRELTWRMDLLRLLRICRRYPSCEEGYDIPDIDRPFTAPPEAAGYIVLMKIRDRQLLESVVLSSRDERIVSKIEGRMSHTLLLHNFNMTSKGK